MGTLRLKEGNRLEVTSEYFLENEPSPVWLHTPGFNCVDMSLCRYNSVDMSQHRAVTCRGQTCLAMAVSPVPSQHGAGGGCLEYTQVEKQWR